MPFEFKPEDYGSYIEQDFRYRWLRPHHLIQKLEKFRRSGKLDWNIIGHSVEGRTIESIGFGKGPVRIMAWSQMHGNEPTATMALVDILNFLTHQDAYDGYRQWLYDHFTLVLIPMLNPDGAERFSRTNALNIDPNRDALRWQSPEMQAFKSLFDRFQPHWGFNLHDQRNFFSAGESPHSATISFLSASADRQRTLTETRKKAMQLIGQVWKQVHHLCENHFGRYTDEFYPRALGEFFHTREVPCVLVESGSYPNDPYRDKARQLNFILLFKALESIQRQSFESESINTYLGIPENGKSLFDLLIRNCHLKLGNTTIRADLGFMYHEKINDDKTGLDKPLILKEVGDLSFHFGLEESEGGVVEDGSALQLEHAAHFELVRTGHTLQFKEGYLTPKNRA